MRNSRRSSNDCALQHPPTDARRVGQPNRPQETPSGRFRPTSPELPREIQGIRNIRGRRHPDCNRRTSKGRTFGRFSLLLWSGKRNSHSRCARAVPRISADTPDPWKGRFEVADAESFMHRHTKQKGKNLLDSSLLFWSGKRDSNSRCARAVREFQQTPPAPGRGALRSQVPSPSCTGIQKKEGRTFWILPSCFGAENGFPTQAYSSFTISALRKGHHALVCIPMLSTKIRNLQSKYKLKIRFCAATALAAQALPSGSIRRVARTKVPRPAGLCQSSVCGRCSRSARR